MKHLPTIKKFLNFIDPHESLNRKKAVADITFIVILRAITEVKNKLSKEKQEKFNQLLQDKKGLDYEKIFNLFNQSGLRKDLIESIVKQGNITRTEYLKNHIDSMSPHKKETIFKKFPSLRNL